MGWLAGWRRPWARAAAVALAVVWLGGLAWSARGFVGQVDHRGLTAQLDALNAALEPESVLLFYDAVPIGNGDFFGTPLQFVYGHNAFALRDADPPGADLVRAVEIWHNSGRAVYWIGDPAWLDEHGLAYETGVYTLTAGGWKRAMSASRRSSSRMSGCCGCLWLRWKSKRNTEGR